MATSLSFSDFSFSNRYHVIQKTRRISLPHQCPTITISRRSCNVGDDNREEMLCNDSLKGLIFQPRQSAGTSAYWMIWFSWKSEWMCFCRRQAERLVAGTSASPGEVGTSLISPCASTQTPLFSPDRLRCN